MPHTDIETEEEFTADAEFAREVSENMFPYPWLTVDEFGANAFDALASRFSIDYRPDLDYLRMTDNGHGMRGRDEVLVYLSPGKSSKRGKHGKGGRAYLGQFGLAAISAPNIADLLEVETVSDGICTTAKVDLTTLLTQGAKHRIRQRDVDTRETGTSLLFKGLKWGFTNQFDMQKYAKEVAWRLPIDRDFSVVVNGTDVQQRSLPTEAGAKLFPIDYTFPGKQSACHAKGMIYLTNSPREHNGFHLYVNRREALSLEKNKFPHLDLKKAGMYSNLIITLDADFLKPYVLFTRESVKSSMEFRTLIEHVQSRLNDVRNYMDSDAWLSTRKRRVSAPAPAAKHIEPAQPMRVVPPPEPKIVEVVKASELDTLAARIKENPYDTLLQIFLPANLPEVPIGTQFVPLHEGPAPIYMTEPGRLLVKTKDFSLAEGMNPLELLGRQVSALVYAIARHRIGKTASTEGIEGMAQKIWATLPLYGGRPEATTRNRSIDPERSYTIAELEKETGMDRGTLRYMLPAMIGQRFDGKTQQLVPGAKFVALSKETAGHIPLYEALRNISREGAVPILNTSHLVLNGMNVKPFLMNASKLNPRGHTYFLDESCQNTVRGPFLRNRDRILREYNTSQNTIPNDLLAALTTDLGARFGSYCTPEELARQGSLNAVQVGQLLEYAGKERLPLTQSARMRKVEEGPSVREYAMRDYVHAVQRQRNGAAQAAVTGKIA